MSLFYDLSLFFAMAAIFGFLAYKLKQPSIVGYILAGVVFNNLFLQGPNHEIEIFSRIGIVFLLFAVGLHLNPEVLKKTGKNSFLAGVGQIVFTFLAAYVLTRSTYVAIALTFSSTIVVVKVLSDKRDLEKLYAKIAIGILIVQDIVASAILLLSGTEIVADDPYKMIYLLIGKLCFLAICLLVACNWIMPTLFKKCAQSGETLFLLTIGWGMGVATIFSLMNLSLEIGALVAGICLSSTPYTEEIGSRIKPVRDMFLVLFFVTLGSQIDLKLLPEILPNAILASIFVLIGGPAITWIVLRILKQGNKVALMTGFTMAQVSEFSLILMQEAKKIDSVSEKEVVMVTVVMTITMIISGYMMQHSERLFMFLLPVLNMVFPKKDGTESVTETENYEIALFGHDRVGADFVDLFVALRKTFFVVDNNPEMVEKVKEGGHVIYSGDADDVEFLELLPTEKLKLVVSTIPDINTTILLCRYLQKYNRNVSFVGIAHNQENAQKLYTAGAAYVIMPHYLGARHAIRIIKKANVSKRNYLGLRKRHMDRLGISI